MGLTFPSLNIFNNPLMLSVKIFKEEISNLRQDSSEHLSMIIGFYIRWSRVQRRLLKVAG